MLKDEYLQIEAQTNQLLGELGMQGQVDRAEQKIQDLREHGGKERVKYGKDINKIRLLNDKMRLQKLKIEHEQKKLLDQSN
jgi:hypothetical protein